MKRIGYLYDKICDKENIKLAIKYASQDKKHRADVQKVLDHLQASIDEIHKILIEKTYQPADYETETIQDGSQHKKRVISKPNFYPDQIIHWCIYLVIKPHIYPRMYNYSCGSIPKKGVHYGKKHIEKWVVNDKKNTKYYLKMDIQKYYPSIDNKILMNKIKRRFKDPDLIEILERIIYKTEGLPIGMLLSQVFANFFADDIDFFIKHKLKAVYYVRYMDDMVIFGRNKKELHKMRKLIDQLLQEHKLTMKKNWQIFKFQCTPLDFMGFRFYRGYTLLRKSIMFRIARKVKKVGKKGKDATFHDACSIMSYMGWVSHTNTYNFYLKRIKPYISIQEMKNIIRRTLNAFI